MQKCTKGKIKEKREKKKSEIPFNFYIVEFGDERNASSLTLFS